MGAVSRIQIKYGCNFVAACKTEGICRFVTKHKKELQEILHNKSRRELERLFQQDNILDWEERIKLCRYIGNHRKEFSVILDADDEEEMQRYLVGYFQKGQVYMYTYEKESATIKRQNVTECEDRIRLKVLTENMGNFHSRLCNEEFRTRKERDATLSVMEALRDLEKIMDEKYAIRKKDYYDQGCSCDFPGEL